MGIGWVVLGAATCVALVDWWAVQRGRRDVERWAKPLTMALLVVAAVVVGDLDGSARALLVVGAVFGLVGDVALLSTGESAFLSGLAAFAVGHLAYVGAGSRSGSTLSGRCRRSSSWSSCCRSASPRRTVPGARRAGGTVLMGAVVFYACVIAAMVLSAWGTAAWVAGLGAMLFAASDWVLGHERFAGPLPGGRLAVMIPYHVGQALLIVGLATAT